MSASLSSFAGERTTVEDLTGGLPAEIDLPQIPFLYRIGLLLVTAAMILLPLLYLGLIGLLAYGIGYHAVTGTWLLSSSPGSGTTWRLTIYLAPIVAGTIAIVFMFKPLLAEASSPPPLYEAKEADHPELFSFLRRLCRILKAAEPSKVYLDCSVNASASFLPGFLNVARGRLALTLGLPLAAGLDLRQLTGVLAHEFGHFSQSAGMRLTYIIRSINAWFWRVVYERDSWDERLERWSKEGNLHIRLIMEVARGTVWVISCYLLRQMEFNADAYEIQLAGSEAFESTVGDLEKLNVAWSLAAPEYYRLWNTGRVADDIPALIAGGVPLLPEPKPGLADEPKEVSSSFFDTHPPDFQRIAAARKMASPGLISIAAPASALFKDFEMVCRDVTRHTHLALWELQ